MKMQTVYLLSVPAALTLAALGWFQLAQSPRPAPKVTPKPAPQTLDTSRKLPLPSEPRALDASSSVCRTSCVLPKNPLPVGTKNRKDVRPLESWETRRPSDWSRPLRFEA